MPYSRTGVTLQLAAETVGSRLRRPTTCSSNASFLTGEVSSAVTSTRPASIIGKQAFEHDKARGANRNQRVGAQSSHPLAPLAFEADAGTEQRCHGKVERGLFDRRDHDQAPVRHDEPRERRVPGQDRRAPMIWLFRLNIARLHVRDQRGRPVSEGRPRCDRPFSRGWRRRDY